MVAVDNVDAPVNRLADAVFDFDKLARVVLVGLQLATRYRAGLLEPLMKAPLHQIDIDVHVRLGQLSGSHPVAEVTDEKRLPSAGRVIAESGRVILFVVEQELVGVVQILMIGKRRRRQEDHFWFCLGAQVLGDLGDFLVDAIPFA